jgi:cysteine desulfurase / selenocysteine lyase
MSLLAPTIQPLDVHLLRQDFPLLARQVHGRPLAYLDNAATAQKPRAVLEALRRYYERDNANVHRGVHQLSERATALYEEARVKVQRFLNARSAQEIVFVRGATEGINLVAQTFGRQVVQAGDEVVVTWMEHHANIVPWQLLCHEKGARLRVVPITDTGELRLDAFARLLTPRTRLVALTHLSNVLGMITPVQALVAQAHAAGIPVLVDGAQAAAHLQVDVQELDCDFYAFSGHKVYGPTGIGVLYGKAALLEQMPPYQGGGDMVRTVSFERTTYQPPPSRFEAGTPHIAGAVGLGAALDYLEQHDFLARFVHEQGLLAYATARLSELPRLRLLGTGPGKAGVLTFVVEDPPLAPLDVAAALDLQGIAVRAGHHCCQPLMQRLGVPGTVRLSLALYNTREEVDRLADALQQLVGATTPAAPAAQNLSYPRPAAEGVEKAADCLAETLEMLGTWPERYQYLIDLGRQLLPFPASARTEANRVRGCQSTVFLHLRVQPGTADVVEFLGDSDSDLVRGLVALLQQLLSGQRAAEVATFQLKDYLARIGLVSNLTLGRRNGLGGMIQRIQQFAQGLALAQP